MSTDRQENREEEITFSSRTEAETLKSSLGLDVPLEELLLDPTFRENWLALEYRDSSDPLYKKLPSRYESLWGEEPGFWRTLREVFTLRGIRLILREYVLIIRDVKDSLVRGMRRRRN